MNRRGDGREGGGHIQPRRDDERWPEKNGGEERRDEMRGRVAGFHLDRAFLPCLTVRYTSQEKDRANFGPCPHLLTVEKVQFREALGRCEA